MNGIRQTMNSLALTAFLLFCAVEVHGQPIVIGSNSGGFTAEINEGDQFGFAIARLGDIDGNGVEDLAVGAPGDEFGALYILFLDGSGNVETHRKFVFPGGGFEDTNSSENRFGHAITRLGDVNGDGIDDLLVASNGTLWTLFMNFDGSVRELVPFISAPSVLSIATVGDLQNDGVVDVGIGTMVSVEIFYMFRDGRIGPSGSDRPDEFSDSDLGYSAGDIRGGSAVAVGDVDGDGWSDVVFGSPGDNDGGLHKGAIRVMFLQGLEVGQDQVLNPFTAVKSFQKISAVEGGFEGELSDFGMFGTSLGRADDLNDDDIPDLLVGTADGSVWVLFLDRLGNVTSELEISANDQAFDGMNLASEGYGKGLSVLDDFTGDGIQEIVISAWGHGGSGAVFILTDLPTRLPPRRAGEF